MNNNKQEIFLNCKRCCHEWTYRGSNKWIASCPHCKTSIYLVKQFLEVNNVRDKGKQQQSQISSRVGSPSSKSQDTVVGAEYEIAFNIDRVLRQAYYLWHSINIDH